MSSAWSGASADIPVSVVIPCFQAHATLPRAVASVAGQSAPALEVIVVDDASDDDTAGVAYELQKTYGSNWVRLIRLERNQGPASARNAGWEAARGECVAFLDADDSWHPRKLEIQCRVMRDNPDVALSAHRHTIGVSAEVAPGALRPQLTEISAAKLLWSNRFVTPSVMLRRSIANRFRAGQRHMEDHLLWLDIAYAGNRIVVIEMPLAILHKPAFGASGQSAQLSAMECAELGNYILLKNEGRISAPLLAVLSAWSLVKFLRRLAVVAVRRFSGAAPTG